MILLTPYYLDSRPERQAELDFCLQQNLQNPLITKVILFLDNSLNALQAQELQSSKLETVDCHKRCTYQDFIDYANKYFQSEIVIIANTDIFFDETLENLENHDLSNTFINLLRWEVIGIDELFIHSQLRASIGSQDAWIFRAPLKPFVACFPLGKPGCDNRIAFEASTVGLCVTNPAFSIRSHHLHLTNIRNYNKQDRISGPYLLMPPEYLEDNLAGENLSYIYMKGDGKDDMALLNARAEQFMRRLPKTVDCQIAYSRDVVSRDLSRLQQSTANLTAVVIAHNSEKTLTITLASLKGCYDQLIVIDAGSTDDTLEIASKYKARIVRAKEGQEVQTMLNCVEGGWVFQLQADEFIDEQTRQILQQFRDACASEQSSPDSYLIMRRWIAPWNTTSYLINTPHGCDMQPRLFRHSKKLFIDKQNPSLLQGFNDLYSDMNYVKIYSLHLTTNTRTLRQQKALRSNWVDNHGETLRLCVPELRKMQASPFDCQQLSSEVNALLQRIEIVNVDPQIPLITAGEKAYPIIVLDGVFFQFSQSGISRVWDTLLKEWSSTDFARHLVVIDRLGSAPKFSGVTYRTAPCFDFDQLILSREYNEQICQEEKASLFVSTYYTTPLACRSVFMAYDMVPEVQGWWDLSKPVWQAKRQAIGHASAYIAISESTARDLTQLFPHISEVNVAYCGVDNHFQPVSLEQVVEFKTKWGITKPYFLIVGTRFQYKNFLLFLLAFADLPNREDFAIVCAGGGPLEAYFQSFARQFSMHMLNLSDQDLANAYGGALALVYPSVYEGFGMPIVEAMACGCPVITCNNSSLPEVAGEAALYVGETDVEEMIAALQQVQEPAVREKLSQAGLEQAKRFSWSRMAETVANVLLKATLPIAPAYENHLLFPDWKCENIAEELTNMLSAWIAHSPSSQTALWIAAADFPAEGEMTTEAFLQGILTEIFFTSGQVTENPIYFLPSLYPTQWQIFLQDRCTYIPMAMENRALVNQLDINHLPKLQLSIAQSVV